MVFNLALKSSRDVAVFASSGSLFHSLIDRGKRPQVPAPSCPLVPRCVVVLWINGYQMVGRFVAH